MPDKPSKLPINFVSLTVPANFNLLCEGQKGHNTGQKGHNTGQEGLLRDKRDKTRSFRRKAPKTPHFGFVLLEFISLLRGFQSYCSLHPDFLIYFALTLGSYYNFSVFISNLSCIIFCIRYLLSLIKVSFRKRVVR